MQKGVTSCRIERPNIDSRAVRQGCVLSKLFFRVVLVDTVKKVGKKIMIRILEIRKS